MERLTNFQGICIKCMDCVEESNCETECGSVDACLTKLKEYEDTGLSPDQVNRLIQALSLVDQIIKAF